MRNKKIILIVCAAVMVLTIGGGLLVHTVKAAPEKAAKQWVESHTKEDGVALFAVAYATQYHPGNTVRTGFTSPAALSSGDLFNIYLTQAAGDETFLNPADGMQHIKTSEVRRVLDQWFEGYTFDPANLSLLQDSYHADQDEFVLSFIMGFDGTFAAGFIELTEVRVEGSGADAAVVLEADVFSGRLDDPDSTVVTGHDTLKFVPAKSGVHLQSLTLGS